MSRDYWLDVGGASVVAICRHCSWRCIAGTMRMATGTAEAHVMAVHPGYPANRITDMRRKRGSVA